MSNPNLPHPFNSEMKSTPKPFRKVLATITFLLIILAVVSSLITFYLFQFRREFIIDTKTKTETITNNEISKSAAEKMNLDNVEKMPKDQSELITGANITYTNSQSSILTALSYEVMDDSSLRKVDTFVELIKRPGFIPIFYISPKTLTTANFDLAKLSALIIAESANFKEVSFDVSFTYIKDFNNFIKPIAANLKSKNVLVDLYLYPSFGKEVNYNYFLQISNDYHRTTKFSDLNNIVDKVIVQLYGFTSEYSILPGPVAPIDWAKQVIQFYISEGIDRNKMFAEINTSNYLWLEREIVTDPKLNYPVADIQGGVVSDAQVQLKQFAIINEAYSFLDMSKEQIALLDHESVKYLLLSPTDENINSLKNLVAEYGLAGYIVR